MKLLVPAYFLEIGGSLAEWESMVGSMKPGSIAVVNPANGPFTKAVEPFTAAIKYAQERGIKVLGYVPTGYAEEKTVEGVHLTKAKIEEYIKQWWSFYSTIEGIFLDEYSELSSTKSFYEGLQTLIHEEGVKGSLKKQGFVVGNPGLTPPTNWALPLVDVLCTFENPSAEYATYSPPSWVTSAEKRQICNLVFAATTLKSMEEDVARAKVRNAEWVYVTNFTEAENPYGKLPSAYTFAFEAALVYSGIALVRNSGQVATTSPLGGGSVTLPITAGAIGNNLVVAVATAAATGAASCSDSSGTTYNLDAEISSGIAITVMIFSAKITTAGVTSISINGFGASLIVEAAAYEFSGMKSAGWFDTKGSGTGIGTSTSAGPTSGNITEGDIWVGAFGSTASLGTFTSAGGASALTGANQTGGSLGAEYLLNPTAGSTATATGTFSTTGTWAGLIVAYKPAPLSASVALNAAGGSSTGAFNATAPTKAALNAGGASSNGSLSLAAPARIALSASAATSGGELFLDSHLDLAPAAGSSGGSLTFAASMGIVSSAASSASSLAASTPTQVGIRASTAQSEAGAPGLEPSEELEPGESLYPGQEDLPLTAPTFIQIIAGASSSTGSMGITAPAKLSLSAEGISSANFADTAPTQIPLNAGIASSSGSLSTTAPAQVSLNLSAGASSAAMGFTAPTFLSLSGEGKSTGSLTATTTAPLILSAAEGVSGGTVFFNAHLDLFPAIGSSTGSLTVRTIAPLPLVPGSGQSASVLSLTANSIVGLSAASGVSSAVLQDTAPTLIETAPAVSSSTASLEIVALSILVHPGLVEPRELSGIVSPVEVYGRV